MVVKECFREGHQMMILAFYHFFYDQCGLRSMAVKLWNDQVRRIYPLSKSLPGSAWICMVAASPGSC